MTFTIAIAGRPNVGKSTLFNRLVGKSMAIVDDTPGVTRDWREGEGSLWEINFRLLDTAGLEDVRPKGSLAARTAARTQEALEQANVIFMIVDGRAGILPDDKTVAREIRKTGKPIILLVNKCESDRLPPGFDDASALGFGEPVAISAQHGQGLIDIYEAVKPHAPKVEEDEEEPFEKPKKAARVSEDEFQEEEEPRHLHIAITGRPNAGKSTLVNCLIGEERMLTGPEPGLTRDAIPIKWQFRGKDIRLVDTAGLRRRSRIDEKLERLSTKETLRAIRLAHVVVLVIDAQMPFDKQDYTIAQHVVEEGRALIIAVNKWDTVDEKPTVMRMIQAKVEASLAQVAGVPIIPISALKDSGTETLMKAVMNTYDVWNKRVTTGQLNRWLEGMQEGHPPPIVSGRRVKLRYMSQVKARPPTFVMFVNKPVDLPESYLRFLTNGIRRAFKLEGVPLRWVLKKGENPYEKRKNS